MTINPIIQEMNCRQKTITWGTHTLLMGILNSTPDSFSDGGLYNNIDAAVIRAQEMVEQGADIIDVGGESTRPGSEVVTLEEELRRVIPVITALKENIDVPISVDTYKAEVARQALDAGAHIINDIWGLKKDPDMAKVVAAYQCPIIIMHNRENRPYTDLMKDIVMDLQESIQIARTAGIADNQIILDPGIGFAKTYKENLILMNHLSDLSILRYPILLGTSRKSMIKNTLGLPATDVMEGTAATVALGIVQGCQMMRVHDVKEMKKVIKMTDAIIYGGY